MHIRVFQTVSPGVVLELEEVVEAVVAVMGSRTFAAALIAFGVTGSWGHADTGETTV